MKKRIALAASIALAISVGGMFPASAAKLGAPTVTTDSCSRAGGQLEVKELNGSITVSLGVGKLVIFSGTDTDVCDANGDGDYTDLGEGSPALAGLTAVLVKVDTGNITIDLTDGTTNIANYGSIPMTLQATGELTFDGGDLSYSGLKAFSGVITEETFTIGSVTGSYYAGGVSFVGGDGADMIDGTGVTTTDLTLSGGAGDDTLKGGAGDDHLYGGFVGDTSDNGDDVLYGNAGDDQIFVADGSNTCKTLPATSNGRGCPSAGTSTGADQGWGGAGDDLITSDGSDTVAPGDGADLISGHVYLLTYVDSSAAISLDLTVGAVVKSTAGDDFFTAGNVVSFAGSELADTMVGTPANDSGVGGEDSLYGNSGADKILGLSGNDLLSGNGGADVIKGGAGTDMVYGESGADLINGGSGNDTIEGGGGDDIMYGSAGDDVIRGSKGSDQAWGGKGTFDVCAAEVTDKCEFKK